MAAAGILSVPAQAATRAAPVEAVTIRPLSLVKTDDLDFALRRWRTLSAVHRQRDFRLRRRAAENRRLFARCRLRPARRFGRDDRLCPCQRDFRRRDPPRGRNAALLDPAKGQPARAAAPEQPPPLYRCLAARCSCPLPPRSSCWRTIDAAARARDPRVSAGFRRLAGSWSVVEIVRADGFVATDVRPLVRLNVGIVAEATAGAKPAASAWAGAGSMTDLFEPRAGTARSTTALAQALTNLESVDAPAGEMTVLLGPGWPGVLLHEAVGHGLEGDFNRKGTSAFSGPDRRAGRRAGRHRGR
jgi:hypothetical protein